MSADEPVYFIRASAEAPVQGPFALSRIKAYVASGRVKANMDFSKDGEHWWPGATWQEVFPEPAPVRPPPPPQQPAPAPAPRRGQAAVPARSRGGSAHRPAQAARARRGDPDTPSHREGPRGRPPRRRPKPALLWAGVLLVVGGTAALLYFALAPSQVEKDLQQMIALMEESAEILEDMAEGEASPERMLRLLVIAGEVQTLRDDLLTVRLTGGDKAAFRKYERRIEELGARVKRASARMKDPDDPAPPVR